MIDAVAKRGEMIERLQEALAVAEDIHDGQTGFLIERAIDQARCSQFRPVASNSRLGR
jgi:hypothetical protein